MTKTICLVVHSLQAGGMERVMAELASFFSGIKNLEVHIVLYGINREIFYSLPPTVIVHKPGFEFNDQRRRLSSLKTLFFLRKKIKELKPEMAYLTHISHQLGLHEQIDRELPPNIRCSYDGLKLTL